MQTVADWLGHLWRHTRKRSQAQLVQLIRQHWLLLTDALILMDDHVCVCVCAFVCVCALCCSLHIVQYLLCSMTGNTQSDREREKERGIERVAIWMLSPWRIYQMFFSSFLYRVNQKISKNHFVRKREWGKKGLGRGPQWNWFYFRLALNLPAMWVTFWFFFFFYFIYCNYVATLVGVGHLHGNNTSTQRVVQNKCQNMSEQQQKQ